MINCEQCGDLGWILVQDDPLLIVWVDSDLMILSSRSDVRGIVLEDDLDCG